MFKLFIALCLVALCAASPVFAKHQVVPPAIVQYVSQFPVFAGECTVESMKLVDAPCLIFLDHKNEVAYCALLDPQQVAYAIVVKKDGMDDHILWKREAQGV